MVNRLLYNQAQRVKMHVKPLGLDSLEYTWMSSYRSLPLEPPGISEVESDLNIY